MNQNNENKPTQLSGLFQSKFAASAPLVGNPQTPRPVLQNTVQAGVNVQSANTQNGTVLNHHQTTAQPLFGKPIAPVQQTTHTGTQQPFVFKPFATPQAQQPSTVKNMNGMVAPFHAGNNVVVGVQTQTMSEALFKDYREYIYKLTGIYFTETKKYLLEGRVSKRMTANGIHTFEQYLDLIKNPVTSQKELPQLFEAITINETYFFRSEQQVEALEKILIPEILKKKTGSNVFKIWSAASSTGEEAYTMAMVITERIKPMFPNIQFQIVGTDINNAVIDSARNGLYREYAIRNVPPNYMQKYFTKNGDLYQLSDSIKRMVSFQYLNLYDTQGMKQMQNFDVIFCCNVLIYFDTASKQQVVAYLYDSLNKNGYLFIGYSESLHGISKAFQLVHLPRALAYVKA